MDRTIRLALKYVELSLAVAPARVQVEDHEPVIGVKSLVYTMGRIYDALNIEYHVQTVLRVDSVDELTGRAKKTPEKYYVYARLRGLKTGFSPSE